MEHCSEEDAALYRDAHEALPPAARATLLLLLWLLYQQKLEEATGAVTRHAPDPPHPLDSPPRQVETRPRRTQATPETPPQSPPSHLPLVRQQPTEPSRHEDELQEPAHISPHISPYLEDELQERARPAPSGEVFSPRRPARAGEI